MFDEAMIKAQIAFALLVIAFSVAYYVFDIVPKRMNKASGKKKR